MNTDCESACHSCEIDRLGVQREDEVNQCVNERETEGRWLVKEKK